MASYKEIELESGEKAWRAWAVAPDGRRVSKQCSPPHARRQAERWAARIESGKEWPDKSKRFFELVDVALGGEWKPSKNPREQVARAAKLAHWKSLLGNSRLSRLNPSAISAAKQRLEKGETRSGEPISSNTVCRYLAALSAVMNVAVRLEWIDRNPVSKVQWPKQENSRVDWIRSHERAPLLDACRSINERLYLFVLLGLSTGARLGELEKLVWDDLDLPQAEIRLWDTKNGTSRTVHLPPAAVQALSAWATKRRGEATYVLEGPKGGTTFKAGRFNQAVEAAGLSTQYTFHHTRHTWATLIAAQGASEAQMMSLGGWETSAMPKRYIHLFGPHTKETAQSIHDLPEFSGIDPVIAPKPAVAVSVLKGLSAAKLRGIVELGKSLSASELDQLAQLRPDELRDLIALVKDRVDRNRPSEQDGARGVCTNREALSR